MKRCVLRTQWAMSAAVGIVLLVAVVSACGAPTSARPTRKPAVAGAFYPADGASLARLVDDLLGRADAVTTSARLRAIIAPHAGYVYSGPVAASAYAAVKGQRFRRVIVLAPTHYAEFRGVAITPADYATPLGTVHVDEVCDKLDELPDFSYRAQALIHAPSGRILPANEEVRPDTFEHSLEVQLPFLQRILATFSLVPLVCGQVDPAAVARSLEPHVDSETLVVASSDLSHYYPYDMARRLDQSCVSAICALDLDKMRQQEACGKAPILVVMNLARRLGWEPVLLDYRNSGDTAGDKSRVVGYAAIAFYEKATTAPPEDVAPRAPNGGGDENQDEVKRTRQVGGHEAMSTPTLTKEEGRLLVKLARAAVEEAVRHRRRLKVDLTQFPPPLRENKGCFVTLTERGELRGCIGHIFPQEPLYQAVIDNAWAAALEDPRFPPVSLAELPLLEIEVSVLTVPQPLPFSSPEDLLAKLRPHVDGVVLKVGPAMATFLPQVWEQLPDKREFLEHLSRKAGCARDAWCGPHVSVMTYQVQVFHESEFEPKARP